MVVQRGQGFDGDRVAPTVPVDEGPTDRAVPVTALLSGTRTSRAPPRPSTGRTVPERCTASASPAPGPLGRRGEGRGAQRHGGGDRAVGQSRQQGGHPVTGLAGQDGGHHHRRQQRPGQECMAHFLEHDGQLRQREALAALALGHVEPEPALSDHLLPHGRQVHGRRRLRHCPGTLGGQCVWAHRCAAWRRDSWSSVTAIGTSDPPLSAPRCRPARARSSDRAALRWRCAAAPPPWLPGSVTTVWPSSLSSKVSGAQNTQLPEPMQRSQSIRTSSGPPIVTPLAGRGRSWAHPRRR